MNSPQRIAWYWLPLVDRGGRWAAGKPKLLGLR